MSRRRILTVLGFVAVVLVSWVLLGGKTVMVESKPGWEPTPFNPDEPVVVEPEQRPHVELVINGQSELDQLVARYGVPPYPHLYSTDVAIGVKPEGGLTIVEHILHSSLADDFLGRFDREFIYPGSIVGCMPYVRADLTGQVHTLGALERLPYTVVMQSYTANNPEDTRPRGQWPIGNGVQNQQAAEFQQVLNDIHSNAEDFTSPIRFRRSSRYARSYAEAQAKLGLSLSTPLMNSNLNTSSRQRADRRVFMGMVQQEFYRIGIAQQQGNTTPGPRAHIVDNASNVAVFGSLMKEGSGSFDIPAIISQVRYGRIVIVAFETEWSESDNEAQLNVNGRWSSGTASVDAFSRDINRAASGTVDIIVYGGADLPLAELDGVEIRTEDGGATRLEVDKGEALEVLNRLLASGKRWDRLQPGVPIGISMTLLDDAGTALQPFNNSLVSMARAMTPRKTWSIELVADVRGDFDGGLFDSAGDWSFQWKYNEKKLADWRRGVDAPTTFRETHKEMVPATWGQSFSGYSIQITEHDDFLRGGNDHSNCDIPGTLILKEPPIYTQFLEQSRVLGDELEALTELFKQARRLEGASDDVKSIQHAMYEQWVQIIKDMEGRLPGINNQLKELRKTTTEAEDMLFKIESNGLGPIQGSDRGNTYSVVAKPDLFPYRRYMRSTCDNLQNSIRNIERYTDVSKRAN